VPEREKLRPSLGKVHPFLGKIAAKC